MNGGLPGFKSHSCLIQKEKVSIVILTNSMDTQDFSWLAATSEFLNMVLMKTEESSEIPQEKPEFPEDFGLFLSPYGIFLILSLTTK